MYNCSSACLECGHARVMYSYVFEYINTKWQMVDCIILYWTSLHSAIIYYIEKTYCCRCQLPVVPFECDEQHERWTNYNLTDLVIVTLLTYMYMYRDLCYSPHCLPCIHKHLFKNGGTCWFPDLWWFSDLMKTILLPFETKWNCIQ